MNLRKKHYSLSVQLVFTKDVFIQKALYAYLNTALMDDIWHCNLKAGDAKNLFTTDCFWKSIVISWCKFNYNYPTSYEEVHKQIIWFNSDIHVNKNPIYNAQAVQQGLRWIEDIWCENRGDFYSFEEVDAKYPKVMTW